MAKSTSNYIPDLIEIANSILPDVALHNRNATTAVTNNARLV
jgi:hypothetical protein